jgi:hypothetical protein
MRIKTLIAGIMTSCLLAACGGGEPEKVQHQGGVKAPALGIYAVPVKASDVIPWMSPSSPDWASAQAFLQEALIPFYAEQRTLFKLQLSGSTVFEIPGANHYIFMSHPDQVEREIKTFLGAK